MKSDYITYIDESFFRWFDWENEDHAYFCHAAITVPTTKSYDLKLFVNNLKEDIIKYYQEEYNTKIENTEIKYNPYIRKLSKNKKALLAQKISYFFEKNKCYCFCFYSSRNALICHYVRDKYYDINIPLLQKITNYKQEEENILNYFKTLKKNAKRRSGELHKLLDSYIKLTQYILNFHVGIKKTFAIQYDSRQAKEDQRLNKHASELIKLTTEHFLKEKSVYIGFDNSQRSENCPGLMLADFVAGDISHLFKKHQSLLEFNSKFEILHADNPNNIIIAPFSPLGILPFRESILERNIVTAILQDQDLLFAKLYKHFANKTISCYAKYGEARHIILENNIILDLAD